MAVIGKRCPVCDSDAIMLFFAFDNMPVVDTVLCKLHAEAMQFSTGELNFE